ncbi:MAG: phosphatase PAP2 family protein [Clostridiales bacterium]|nr:phosphatase PAP2 family protein [Clostridiales bacterium]
MNFDWSVFENFDWSVYEAFSGIRSSVMYYISFFFSLFGEAVFIVPIVLFAIFCLMTKKLRKTGCVLLGAIVIGTILTNVILKPLLDRPRPYKYYADNDVFMKWYNDAHAHEESDKSFPSGHTTFAVEIALSLFMTLSKKYSWVFLCMAVGTGLSRIYLCVHYPSDVVGGCFIGIIAGILSFVISTLILKWVEKSDNNFLKKVNEFDLIERIKGKKNKEA